MAGRDGGTQMWCPTCDEIRVCKAIPTTILGMESGQRWHRIDHEDLSWFRRGRQCLQCGDQWLTSEIREDFLDELVELRNALADLKSNAEAYVASSEKAQVALRKLTKSLQVLRALEMYKTADLL